MLIEILKSTYSRKSSEMNDFLNFLFMSTFIMSKNISSSPVVVVQSKLVSSFVSEYSLCITKTASSVLELASIVYRAKSDLSKKEYDFFLREINVDESKTSYLKKLQCIAQRASRLDAIKDKLPAAYTTLYALSQLTDDDFLRAQSENLINPNLTVAELSKFKIKAPKQLSISSDKVTITLKSSSASFYKVLEEIKYLCMQNKIEIKSSFDFTTLNHQVSEEIEDISFRSVPQAA
jgi:hypothetical protein